MQEELKEEGIVVNTHDGYAELKLIENDNCEECSAKLFCKPKEDNSKSLTVKNKDGLTIGDKVMITIPGSTLLKASLNLYLYPLILLVLSIIGGTYIFQDSKFTELYSFLISAGVMILYYLLFFIIIKDKEEKEPQIIVSKS
jgi:sigma-E factor negative regulatory protein RseC